MSPYNDGPVVVGIVNVYTNEAKKWQLTNNMSNWNKTFGDAWYRPCHYDKYFTKTLRYTYTNINLGWYCGCDLKVVDTYGNEKFHV